MKAITSTARALCAITTLLLVACGPSGGSPDANIVFDDANTLIVDAFGGSKFGEECTTSDECQPDGFCVEGSNHDVCTYPCDAGCPEGWNCRASDVAGSLVSLCMPQKFDFCKPCTADVQCNGGVCVQLDGEGFCLPDCPFEGSCPTGYSCEPDPSGVHTGHDYCVPDTGSCSCTAQQEGQVRTCETTNAAGTCYGLETCQPASGGWSGCTATTASTEVCDGADNDCDQLIDDGVSGSACAITNAAGTCPGVQVCNGTTFSCQGKPPAAETCNYLDDNCNNMIDETWPTLSDVCSIGVGSCTGFGVIRCNSAGTGIECSAVEGSPMTELCNGLDDNCNSQTDETFKTGSTALGVTCSAGVGACLRQGNYVCNSSGSATQCSVTAGPMATETCNLVDDDCDTKVDENFKNLSGQYDKNTSCGSCSTDCTVLYAVANATGVCVVSGSPACQMQCAANAFNVDGATSNGCELVLDPMAIYVSKDDPMAVDDATCGLGPVGTGAGNYPCKTIAQGLTRSTQTGRPRVRVANATYAETITLVNGKSLLGGHRPDNWQRNVAGTSTVLGGVATIATTNHDYVVQAINITAATTFEGFVVLGPVNSKTRGNSYAIYSSGSSANLSILNNQIYSGRGGPGTDGGSGGPGALGVDGVGRESSPTAYDAKVTTGTGFCDPASNDRAYVNGGVRSCGADNVSGGNGGGNRCNPRPVYNSENSGLDGFAGQVGDPTLGGAAGAGQDAGDDAAIGVRTTPPPQPMTYTLCLVPSNADYGLDGQSGSDASHGSTGAGCMSATGSVTSGHWTGSTGGTGGGGGNGGGGGGGGAGGGSRCAAAMQYCLATSMGNCVEYLLACSDSHDRLGGHGGGAGSGGCGGAGGGAATAGGGAFGLFIVGGTAPVVSGNTIIRGEGGTGGVGGAGGKGGIGGNGAAGGTSGVFCAGAAGRGGNGGDGGHGAGGGGGCGGGSFGVFTSGVGTPNYCQAAANNAISSGAGGAGGAGGYSLINTGTTGAAGSLGTCQFN